MSKSIDNFMERLLNDSLTLDEKQFIANYLRYVLFQSEQLLNFVNEGGKE